MQLYNYYHCTECDRERTDAWSAQYNDDCPFCSERHMSPYKTQYATEGDDE
jgi:DNA-directed RNA polymerase subunit RPC12/RpoP